MAQLILSGIGVASLVIASWPAVQTIETEHYINPVTFQRIKVGMIEKDAIKLLGVECGEYFVGRIQFRNQWKKITITCPDGRLRFQGELKGWISNDCAIWLLVDDRGVVVSKSMLPVETQSIAVRRVQKPKVGQT